MSIFWEKSRLKKSYTSWAGGSGGVQLSPSKWEAKSAQSFAVQGWMKMSAEMMITQFTILCWELSAHTHIHIHTWIYVYIQPSHPYVYTHVYTHTYLHTHTNMDLGVERISQRGAVSQYPAFESLGEIPGMKQGWPGLHASLPHDFGSFIWTLKYHIIIQPHFTLLFCKVKGYQETPVDLCYTIMHEVNCMISFCITLRIWGKLFSLG